MQIGVKINKGSIDAVTVPTGTSLEKVLQGFAVMYEFDVAEAAVRLNFNLVPPEEYESETLCERDSVEIMVDLKQEDMLSYQVLTILGRIRFKAPNEWHALNDAAKLEMARLLSVLRVAAGGESDSGE